MTTIEDPRSLMGEPSPEGRFGEFGGRFVPETLVPACMELEQAFRSALMYEPDNALFKEKADECNKAIGHDRFKIR